MLTLIDVFLYGLVIGCGCLTSVWLYRIWGPVGAIVGFWAGFAIAGYAIKALIKWLDKDGGPKEPTCICGAADYKYGEILTDAEGKAYGRNQVCAVCGRSYLCRFTGTFRLLDENGIETPFMMLSPDGHWVPDVQNRHGDNEKG